MLNVYLETLSIYHANYFLSSKATSDDSFQKPEPNSSSREQILLWRKLKLKAFHFCDRKLISQKVQTLTSK